MGLDINQIINLIMGFFNKQQPQPALQPIKSEQSKPAGIDWSDMNCKVSKYFTVKEMLWLPSWNRAANESDGLNDEIKNNLIKLAQKMDIVREYFGKPIRVHVCYRPLEYNKAIGGALHSAHSEGGAMDFDVIGLDCDAAREQINKDKKLEEWNMRMEDLSAFASRNWVHLDIRELSLGGNRFFKP